MKLSNLLLIASVYGKSGRNWVGKNSNRYVPECESGSYNVADVKALEEKLNEQQSEYEKLQEKFTKEFELVANKILEEKTSKFTEQNKENLDSILSPLKERIKEFQEKVETNCEF